MTSRFRTPQLPTLPPFKLWLARKRDRRRNNASAVTAPPGATTTRDWRLAGLLLLALTLLGGSCIAVVAREYTAVHLGIEQRLQNLSAGLQASMTSQLRQAAFSLRGILEECGDQPFTNQAQWRLGLRHAARYDPVSVVLGVVRGEAMIAVTQDGVSLDASELHDISARLRMSLATPRSSLPSAGRPAVTLYPLIRHPESGQWLLPLVRDVDDVDGVLLRLVALVPALALTESSLSLQAQPGSAVLVATLDGLRLFRHEPADQSFVANGPALRPENRDRILATPQGVLRIRSAVDGVAQTYGYASSPELPFVVAAGVPTVNVGQAWLQSVAPLVGMMLLGIAGVLMFWLLLRRSVCRQLEAARAREHAALHDALTGAMNRDAFLRRIEQQISCTPAARFWFVLLDLNRFREINDTLGHAIGDEVLQQVARRVQNEIRPWSDAVCRIGGDQLCFQLSLQDGSIDPVLGTLQANVARAISVRNMKLEVTSSTGVACYPDDATSVFNLLRCADIALHQAKTEMRPIARYETRFDRFSPELLALRADLAQAVRDGTLHLVYQPKVSLRDGSVHGVEALARWHHPTHGAIPPARFVPLVELTELIHPFTRLVLTLALQAQARWMAAGRQLPVAVNVSANNLHDAEFVPTLQRLLQEHRVPAAHLELEVTETAVMRNPDLIIPRLQALCEMGVKLSIDDFGSGFTALAYLKQLPVHRLKIDRSFVTHMDRDTADERIVRSTLDLAHGFGLQVVAEGVETDAVRLKLAEMGCDQAQGFLFARPLEEPALLAFTKV